MTKITHKMVQFTKRQVQSIVHKHIPQKYIKTFQSWYKDKYSSDIFYGVKSRKTAIYNFLYYISSAKGQSVCAEELGFPHSDMHQVFGTVRRRLAEFSTQFITPGTLKERKTASRKYSKYPEFEKVTLIGDCFKFKINQTRLGKNVDDYWSHDHPKSYAVKFFVAISKDQIVRTLYRPYHAKEADSKTLINNKLDFCFKFCKGDTIQFDTHFGPAAREVKLHVQSLVKKTKPRKREFTPEEELFNEHHKTEGFKIERIKPSLKQALPILDKPLSIRPDVVADYVKIACSLHNYRLGINNS
jgi:hypothetical protein